MKVSLFYVQQNKVKNADAFEKHYLKKIKKNMSLQIISIQSFASVPSVPKISIFLLFKFSMTLSAIDCMCRPEVPEATIIKDVKDDISSTSKEHMFIALSSSKELLQFFTISFEDLGLGDIYRNYNHLINLSRISF